MFTAKLNLATITASIHLPLAVSRALPSLIQCLRDALLPAHHNAAL
ncbi:hypothetical protein [Serratia symbiotica]|nr:hypothetical protein [Serratia symbiotica]